MSALTDRLRADITATQADIHRIEGQQANAVEAQAELEAEAKKLGFSTDPTKIRAEVSAMEADVEETLQGLREEVEALGRSANPGD